MLDTQEKQRFTATVVPGAALPWQVLGSVGGYTLYDMYIFCKYPEYLHMSHVHTQAGYTMLMNQ